MATRRSRRREHEPCARPLSAMRPAEPLQSEPDNETPLLGVIFSYREPIRQANPSEAAPDRSSAQRRSITFPTKIHWMVAAPEERASCAWRARVWRQPSLPASSWRQPSSWRTSSWRTSSRPPSSLQPCASPSWRRPCGQSSSRRLSSRASSSQRTSSPPSSLVLSPYVTSLPIACICARFKAARRNVKEGTFVLLARKR